MATITQNYYTKGTYTLILRYYGNGGTPPSNTTKSTSSSAATVTLSANITSALPTRDGYRFIGWATSASGSVKYQPGDKRSYTFNRSASFDHQDREEPGDGNVYIFNYYNTGNQSQYVNLYAKWEAAGSTVSASNGTLGVQQTITVTRVSSSYTHRIRYSFAGQTGTIANDVSTSCTWTPAITLAELIPNAKSAACTIYCDTYSNGTSIGTSQTTITLSVPSSVKCSISSVTLAEQNADVATKFSAYVQTKSELSVTGTFVQGSGSPTYGATVESVSININGQTLTGNGAITNLLQTSGTNAYSMTITDSRGRTDTYTGTFNVLPYNAPSVSATAERNATTNSTIDVSYTWNVSSCNDLNDKTVTITLESNGVVEDTQEITPASYSGTGTYSFTGTDTSEPYTVTVELEDYFTTVQTASQISSVGSRIYRISAADKTISRHGENPEDGKDHQYFDEVFHGNVELGEGRVPFKTLWTGRWSSGSITVDNFDKYNIFLIRVAIKSDHSGVSTCIFAARGGSGNNRLRGIGGFANGGSAYSQYQFSAESSGDTLTWGYCTTFSSTALSTYTALEVIAIVGIL